MNTTPHTRTYYTMESFIWVVPGHAQAPYWRRAGSMPGGNSIEEAYARIKQEISHIDKPDATKILIKETMETVRYVEKLAGSDFTAFLLKTA